MRKFYQWVIWGLVGIGLGGTDYATQAKVHSHRSDNHQIVSERGDAVSGHHADRSLTRGKDLYGAGQFLKAATAWQVAAQAYANQGRPADQALSLSYAALAYQKLAQWKVAEEAILNSLSLLHSAEVIEPIIWAHAFNTQASLLLATGRAEGAVETWQQAQLFYQQAGDIQGAWGCQINQAQAWQSLGFYRRARNLLETINQKLEQTPASQLKVRGLQSLGTALEVLGDAQASQGILKQSLNLARSLGATSEINVILLGLGHTALDLDQPDVALDYFKQAEQAAKYPLEQVEAQLNQLSAYLTLGQQQQAITLAPAIYRQLTTLAPSRATIYSTINLVYTLLKLEPGTNPVPTRNLDQLLAGAVQIARQLQDKRAEAYALVQWGQLHAQTGEPNLAFSYSNQALILAQSIQAADVASLAAWQLGKHRAGQGQRQQAISAYQEAVDALQSLRGDLVATNSEVQFSFRDQVEPIYREFVALLLIEPTPSQQDLMQARQLIEALQLAELDNFFREACVDIEPVPIDQIDPSTALIYPIILPQHLAIIVSRPQQPIRYYTIPRSQAEVERAIDQLLESLSLAYGNTERLQRSQRLYNWLIRPAHRDQAFAGVKTLVFVLDGALRNVPMAALYDGDQYLIETFNVALSPGLQLLGPTPLTSNKLETLVGGLSQSRQGFSALPAVTSEIEKLAQTFPTSVLLDQTFTQDNFARQVTTSSASIVHLATHGRFSSNAVGTFLLTWDGRIGVKALSELLANREIGQDGAIELLVLSACQTALGDDRAVLGLAGFAVRSGARSTLATLWTVKDASTAKFMNVFYQQLRQPGTTKAEAVRQAQLALLQDRDYDDPFFWAPFVLIGNWL